MSKISQKLRKHLYILNKVINQPSWEVNDVDIMAHSAKKALQLANEIHKNELDIPEEFVYANGVINHNLVLMENDK